VLRDGQGNAPTRLPTLEPLTRLDVERVLVTHGRAGAARRGRTLAASLAQPPWSRSSLY